MPGPINAGANCLLRRPPHRRNRVSRAYGSSRSARTTLRLTRPAPRQRRADQRAIGAFRPRRRSVEAEPCQAFMVRGIGDARQTLPQQSGQALRRTLRLLQDLQSRNQPLFGVGEIAAERKRWQQAGLARRL